MGDRIERKTDEIEGIIQKLAGLNVGELEEIKAVVNGLISSMGGTDISSQREVGYIEWKMIPDKKTGKVYGPYPYLRYCSGGRLRSKYLKNYPGGLEEQ